MLKLPIAVFSFILFLLSMVQLFVQTPMLLLERIFPNGGWVEVIIVSIYGAIIAYKMQDIQKSSKWRLISWSVFSVWFFLQLLIGIVADERFLLTGKLHLPVPAVMIGGPIYRGQLSVMTLLFLSTILLSGPAWCSHLCYFGAIDGLIAGKRKAKPKALNSKTKTIKGSILLLVITIAIIFRIFGTSALYATMAGIAFGLIGIIVMIIFSQKKGKMVHCVLYCPIGTLVNYFRFINPFRIYIQTNCTKCMACTAVCRYDALNIIDIQNKKPGITCTLCGDCLKSCSGNSIHYKLFRLNPKKSRNIYLFITISLHAVFLAMGRL